MSKWSPQQKQLIQVLSLGAIIVLAFFMTSIPRWNYLYPIHSDEWMHYGNIQSLMETTKISYPEPGESGRVFSPDVEIGFHLLLAELKHITGMSWLDVFRFVPGIILALLSFQVYVVTGRKWTVVISAFFVTLLPTTIRFLGPAFLVPVALGLVFIPLVLLVLRQFPDDPRGRALLVLSLFSLLFIHPPTFIIVSIIAIVHLILHFLSKEKVQNNRRLTGVSLAAIGAIYIFGFFWASSYVHYNIGEALTPQSEISQPPITDIIARFGYILPLLFVVGAGILVYRGKRDDWTLVLPATGLLAFMLVYSHLFIGPDIVYERGWLYLYVLMALIGGVTVGSIWQLLRDLFKRWAILAGILSYGIVTILLILNLAFSLRSHIVEPYYRLVDDTNYRDFLWVRENVSPDYQTGIADLGLNYPLAAVSGKYVYVGEVSPNLRLKMPMVEEFFRDNAADTPWLISQGLSMVYTSRPVSNNHLNKVNHNLYLLVENSED